MNSYGSSNSGFAVSPRRLEYQQLFCGGSTTFPPAVPDQLDQPSLVMSQQQATQLQNIQKQSAFHTRVRDMYFASWSQQQQQQQHHQPESVWQGHKDPKVYEGDEVHCFNTHCRMTFRYNTHLVAHIVAGECAEITMNDVAILVRDWKALQIELGRCGKLTNDEISCLERAWDFLQCEQQKSRMITRELIGYLVLAWEILSGNRSRYTLNPATAPSSLIQEEQSSSSLMQENAASDADQGWRARFRYSTGNSKNR